MGIYFDFSRRQSIFEQVEIVDQGSNGVGLSNDLQLSEFEDPST